MQTGKYISVYVILFISISLSLNAQVSFRGKIIDAESQLPLPGATIYFPDIRSGGVSDQDGKFEINSLPENKLLVQITFTGYTSVIEMVDLSIVKEKNYSLVEAITEINEVVITGLSQSGEANRTSTPITIITKSALLETNSSNIIDALALEPGISQISTGPAISKPQIRGLGYNRVVIVNDGIRQEGQQWGDEHGIEIDEYSVNRIEILKGPASIAYGSDALAGVIHFITSPTLANNTIKANFITNYQTNNGLYAYSGNFAGNNNGFIWDARYSSKNAHAYQNKYDGFVYGSGFRENSSKVIFGLNRKWGYARLHAGLYNLNVGIVEGERDSITGQFIKPYISGDSVHVDIIVPGNELRSYEIGLPYQKINHYKSVFESKLFTGNGSINITLGWQQNNRKEFDDVLSPEDYALFFKLNTISYDIKYLFPTKNKWQPAIGMNGMGQNSQNLGEEVLIPEYNLLDIGIFGTVKRNFNKLDIAAGARFDNRHLNALEYANINNALIFTGFKRNFSAISGSIGGTYQFSSEYYMKLNFARGFRSPNLAELGSNGVHEGTLRYETGNTLLNPEISFQSDLSFGYDGEHLFHNNISNFIYLTKLNNASGTDSVVQVDNNNFEVFTFIQDDAILSGGEFILDIHPHPFHWLHFENSFSFVYATRTNGSDSTKYLPLTPAPKLVSELRGNFKSVNKSLANTYIQLQSENYFVQKNIYSAYGTETKTPAYSLLNFGTGTDILSNKKTVLSIYFSVNNIADIAYQNHLSRLKYAGENYATGRTGIYGMGRNFSAKLLIPINIKE